MKKLCFSLGVLVCLYANSQSYSIQGSITGYENRPVFLGLLKGHTTLFMDTTFTNASGQFEFPVKSYYSSGLYRVFMKDKYSNNLLEQGINFVVNKKESIVFTTSLEFLYNDLTISGSPENKAYYSFLFRYKNLLESFGFYRNKIYYYSEADTFYPRMIRTINDLQQKISLLCKSVSDSFPGTMLSSIISTYQIPFIDFFLPEEQRTEELKSRFFDYVNFSDTIILYSDRLPNKIMEYMQFFYDPQMPKELQSEEFIKASDRLLGKAYDNQQVYKYVLNYLVGLFENNREEAVLAFLARYMEENRCEADNLGEAEFKLARYLELSIGSKFPAIEFNDVRTQKAGSLESIKAKYVLVVFWASFCNHCTQMLPHIKQIFDKYPRAYFDVIAISVDDTRDFYLDMIEENGFTAWHNVCDFGGWKGYWATQFNVKYTPMTYLVDEKRIIVAKPNEKELAEFLEKNYTKK